MTTNRKRAAKKIAAEQDISYMQALASVLSTDPLTVCVTCGHAAAHNTGGLGVCDTDDCGCDGPTTGEPNPNFRYRKAEIAAKNAVRKHLPEYVTVTAVYDYSTMTVTLPFPDFDLTDWDHGAVDVEAFEDEVAEALTNEGMDREYNDLVIDGSGLEDAFADILEDAFVRAGMENPALTYEAAEMLYARFGASEVINYANSITAFPIRWTECGACEAEMPVDPESDTCCLACGSTVPAGEKG